MADENQNTPPAGGGESPQVSPAFAAKMASIESAVGQGESSLFNESATPQTPPANTAPPTEVNEPSAGTPTTANTGEPQQLTGEGEQAPETGENTPPPVVVDPNAPDLSLNKEVAEMNSKITGKVEFEQTQESSDPAPASQGFNSWEDFEGFINSAGYDGITKDNVTEKLTEAFENSKKHVQTSEQLKNYNSIFENLPADIMAGVRSWANGDSDYREKMNSVVTTDFSKGFDDHGAKGMVESYFPGKITSEEWAEYKEVDADPAVKEKVSSYLELTKEKYSLDQGRFEQQKINIENNAKETLAYRQSAFEKSRENFPKTFEEQSGFAVQSDYTAGLDNHVKDQQSVLAVFFNEDGSLKGDAHYRMAMALDGGDVVSQQAAALKNRIITQAREEVVKDAPEATGIKKTGDSTSLSNAEKSQQKINNYISQVLPGPDAKTY